MKQIITLLLLTVGLGLHAADAVKLQADSAYAKENFEQAARLYSQAQPSAAVCYNLGNCYFRLDDMARAVLWYERASLLSPGDSDIRFNLDMARSKTIDKVVPQHEFFFVGWYRWLVNLMSIDAWGTLSLTLFVLCLVAFAVYLFTEPVWLRKAGFASCVVLLLLCVFGNVCGFSQRYRLTHRTGAIVMASSAVVKSTPAESGSDLFVLHEGTRVEITDDALNNWYEVHLADGKQGWIARKNVEII
ncbi:MAG: tetratricopeptide repeat protein [Bacteroidaceae bacterium]|nr:tetratricopeptide repeat protein [Bacteroidaceae bacterium]